MKDQEQEYTTSDVARLLGVAVRTVQGYIWDDRLVAERRQTAGLDWQYIIKRSDLERFIAVHKLPIELSDQ